MPELSAIDATITDPPYGVTNLAWDKVCTGWLDLVPSRALWCFGSMLFFMGHAFPGWKYSQEIIWEKHNGSNFHADRFRRVHEIAMMFYRGSWGDLYKEVPVTMDATPRTVRRKAKPQHHLGAVQAGHYVSEDGGPQTRRLLGLLRIHSVMRITGPVHKRPRFAHKLCRSNRAGSRCRRIFGQGSCRQFRSTRSP